MPHLLNWRLEITVRRGHCKFVGRGKRERARRAEFFHVDVDEEMSERLSRFL